MGRLGLVFRATFLLAAVSGADLAQAACTVGNSDCFSTPAPAPGGLFRWVPGGMAHCPSGQTSHRCEAIPAPPPPSPTSRSCTAAEVSANPSPSNGTPGTECQCTATTTGSQTMVEWSCLSTGNPLHCHQDERHARADLGCRSGQLFSQADPRCPEIGGVRTRRWYCRALIDCSKTWQTEARDLSLRLRRAGIIPSTSTEGAPTGDGLTLAQAREESRALCENNTELRRWRDQLYAQCWRRAPGSLHPNNPYSVPAADGSAGPEARPLPLALEDVNPSVAENRQRVEVYYSRYIACGCTKLLKANTATHLTTPWNFPPNGSAYGGGLPSPGHCDQYSQFVEPATGSAPPVAPAAVGGGDAN
jgi:hypothetical protein